LGPLFFNLLAEPIHRGTARHARPLGGVQTRLHLPALLHVHGQGEAACVDWAACKLRLGTQPARGTTCCFSTQTRKQKSGQPPEKKKTKRKNIGEGDVKITPRADPHTTIPKRAHTPPTPSAHSHSLAPRLHVHTRSAISPRRVKPTPLPHHTKHSFPHFSRVLPPTQPSTPHHTAAP
jgi:hypothetical protein